MAVLFRKSAKILPGVKLNASKSGLGVTIGGPAGRISISPKGKVSVGQSIPGTGIYTRTEVGQIGGKKKPAHVQQTPALTEDELNQEARITITATRAHKEILQAMAKAKGVSVSAIVVEILDEKFQEMMDAAEE